MGKEKYCGDREAKIIRERRDELYMTQLQVAVEAGLQCSACRNISVTNTEKRSSPM